MAADSVGGAPSLVARALARAAECVDETTESVATASAPLAGEVVHDVRLTYKRLHALCSLVGPASERAAATRDPPCDGAPAEARGDARRADERMRDVHRALSRARQLDVLPEVARDIGASAS